MPSKKERVSASTQKHLLFELLVVCGVNEEDLLELHHTIIGRFVGFGSSFFFRIVQRVFSFHEGINERYHLVFVGLQLGFARFSSPFGHLEII